MSKIIKQFKLWSLLLSALLLLPFCFACNAGTAAGANLLNIEGEVLVKKAGTSDWVTAKVDMELKAGDVVKAGNAADAVVTFFDGSTIELKADTQVEIQELVQGKTTSIRLQQVIGESISRVKKLVDPASRYEIETPAAIAGVRGTIMSVTVAENGTTIVGNEEGLVSVTAQGKEVLIPKGKHSIINPGETPSEPLEGTTSTIVSTPVQSIVGDFSTNGDAISGWYWLRDSALQQYAQWIAPSLMMNSNSLNLQITALATNAMSGGRGYDANFLLYYGIFQGKPTQVDTSKLKMVQVNLPNVSPTSDPVGYTCEGTVTLQGVEFTAGSVLVIRVVRESPDANHVAFNKDSMCYYLSSVTKTQNESIVGDFSTNGDTISGWYWLRDSALQQYAQWIAPSLMMNGNSLNLQITALATNAMSGGRGYDADFLLYYGIFQGKPTQVDTSKLKMVRVNLPNVSPTSDPVGYTCEGTVTLQGVEFTAGSVLVIRVVRESPDANHVAFNKDSISYSP